MLVLAQFNIAYNIIIIIKIKKLFLAETTKIYAKIYIYFNLFFNKYILSIIY